MFDRLDSRRLRRALTLLLLCLSQLMAIAAAAQPACPSADCEDETSVAYAAKVLANAPVDNEEHPSACQIVVSSCSSAAFCMPVVEAAYAVTERTADDSAQHDRLPLGRAVPPLYGPPRT